MLCTICKNLSFQIICKNCQSTLLKANFYKRKLNSEITNYSFYALSDIEELLNSKYYFHGDRVFNILAKLSFKKFANNFNLDENIYALPLDDHTRHDFSHTAVLSRHLNSKNITSVYNCIKASNIVKYAGRDLEFRQKNKRDFKTNIKNKKLILVDDIITTGTTLNEAYEVCKKANNEVLFTLTLADAKI